MTDQIKWDDFTPIENQPNTAGLPSRLLKESDMRQVVAMSPQERAVRNASEALTGWGDELDREIAKQRDPKLRAVLEEERAKRNGGQPQAAAPADSGIKWDNFSPVSSAKAAEKPYDPMVDVNAPKVDGESVVDSFTRNMKKTLPQTKQLLSGSAALIADTIGADSVRDWFMDAYQSGEHAVQEQTRPTDSWSKEGSNNIGKFIAGSSGYFVGQMLESAAVALSAGAVGAAAGGVGAIPAAAGGLLLKSSAKLAIKEATETLIAAQMKKSIAAGATEEVARKAAEQIGADLAKSMTKKLAGRELGVGSAMIAQGVGMETGEIYGDLYTKAKAEGRDVTAEERQNAWLYGSLAGAVEGIVDKYNLDAVMGGGAKAPGLKNRMMGVIRGAAKAEAREVPTEIVQTGLERAGKGEEWRPSDPEARKEYVDTAAMTAAGSWIPGLGGAMVINTPADPAEKPQPQPNSPLTNAANAGTTEAPVSPAAGIAGTAPVSFGSPDLDRQHAEIAAFINGDGNLARLRSIDPNLPGEALHIWNNVINNPDLPTKTRINALAQGHSMLTNLPNFTMSGAQNEQAENLPVPGNARSPAGTAVGPADPAAGSIPGQATRMSGELGQQQRLAAPEQGPTRALPSPQAIAAKRDANAAYEQAFADLLKSEALGANDTEFQHRQQALREAEDRLHDITAEIDGNRAAQTVANRRRILDQVLADHAIQNHAAAFRAALIRAGRNDSGSLSEDEAARIERFQAAKAAFTAEQAPEVEPSTPNEMPADLVPEKQAKQAQQKKALAAIAAKFKARSVAKTAAELPQQSTTAIPPAATAMAESQQPQGAIAAELPQVAENQQQKDDEKEFDNFFTEEKSDLAERRDRFKKAAQDVKENIKQGMAAMNRVISQKVDAPHAMVRPEHGWVSFVWGKEGNPSKDFAGGSGVSKIIAKRASEGSDGDAVARKMVEVIALGSAGPVYGPNGGERFNVSYDGHTAVLSLHRFGQEETWLLTGWDDVRSDGAEAGNASDTYASSSSGIQTKKGADDKSLFDQSTKSNPSQEKSIADGAEAGNASASDTTLGGKKDAAEGREWVRSEIESLIRRRAAAKEIGKGKELSKVIALAERYMTGETAEPIAFLSFVPSFRQDPETANIIKSIAERIKETSAAKQKPAKTANDRGLSVGGDKWNSVDNEPIAVENGVVKIGKYPLEDVDGNLVTVANDATPAQIAAAVEKSGQFPGRKVFGVPVVSEKKSAIDKASDSIDAKINDVASRLAEKLKAKRGTLNSGVDPELLMLGAELGALYISKGLVKFAQYSKAIIDKMRSLGIESDEVKPMLKEFYLATQAKVDDETFEQMDDARVVRSFDLGSIASDAPNNNPNVILDKETESRIRDLYRTALSRKDGNKAFADFGAVNPRVAARVKELTGVDVSGFMHSIDEAAIRHIIKKHGDPSGEGGRNQVAVTEDDIAKLPLVTGDPDSIEYGEPTNDGKQTVIFKKKLGDVVLYVQELREGRNKLAAKTLWKVRVVPHAATGEVGEAHTSETSERDNSTGSQSVAPPANWRKSYGAMSKYAEARQEGGITEGAQSLSSQVTLAAVSETDQKEKVTPAPVVKKRTGRAIDKTIDAERDSLFMAIARLGGMKTDAVIGGWGHDKKDFKQGRMMGFGLRVLKSNGMPPDGILEHLKQFGYFDQEATLTDFEQAFREEASGNLQFTPEGIQHGASANAEMQRRAALEAEEVTDIPAYDEASEQVQVIAELVADIPDIPMFDEDEAIDFNSPENLAAAAAFMGETTESANERFRNAGENTAENTHEDQGANDASSEGRAAEGVATGSATGFALAGQTNEEIAQHEVDRVAAESAKASEAAKEAADKVKAEKQSLEDAVKAHAANPDNFMFGESGKQAAKPMGSLFDQPLISQPAQAEETPALIRKGDRFKDGQGNEFEIWNARSSLIEAFPVIDGKMRISNDTGVRFATDARARSANPEARTDFFPMAAVKKPVTPQVPTGDMEKYIKVAADSINELRKADVYRVLVESNRIEFRQGIANYIKENRPDLAEEVDSVLAEEDAPTAKIETLDTSAEPVRETAENDHNRFSLERIVDGGMEPIQFRRGEEVKIAGSFPMIVGTIAGISHAKREFKIGNIWYEFGLAYPKSYDEYAAPRAKTEKSLGVLEARIADGNTIEFQQLIEPIQKNVENFGFGAEFDERIADLVSANARLEKFKERQREEERTADAEAQAEGQRIKRENAKPVDPVRMTMAEWKATSKDFKGIIDGQRTVLRAGGIVPVEIVNAQKTEEPAQDLFIKAPNGSIDFGEITSDMSKEMKRQAGKIRLQQGIQNSDGTGNGLVHIEANHGVQIRNAGFASVEEFVSHVATKFNEVLQSEGRQLLVAVDGGRQDVMFVQLEPSSGGDFYRINTAFPASRDYLEKQQRKGMKLLWGGSEPVPSVAGQQPLYAGNPEGASGQAAPIAQGQSSKPSVPNQQPEDKSIPSSVEKAEVAMEPTWDSFVDFWNGMIDGNGAIDDVQEAFATILDRADEFKTSIGKIKNKQLEKMLGWSVRPGDKKSDMVSKLYDGTLTRFTLNKEVPSKHWSYGDNLEKVEREYNEGLRTIVNGLTDADLTEFRDQIVENAKAKKEALEEKKAAVADPKTLEDFSQYLTFNQNTGKTRQEAYQALTSEQKALWDRLAAEKTRSERANRKEAQQSMVAVASQTTGTSEIVKGKHTKHGHDLYILNLTERVTPEAFKELLAQAKKLGGDYSSYRGNGATPGWQFRTQEGAEAFAKLVSGDTSQAQEVVKERRDAYADDRSQSAVERLNEMADRLEDSADASMNQERKANTARRARFAASAEAAASNQQALAKTMRNIAGAIESGTAKFLDRVRQKVQIELLQDALRTAKDDEIRAKYPSYADQARHKGEPATGETAEYAAWPSYTLYRSDLATLGRKLLDVDGTKKLGQSILKVADDVTDAYLAFAKANLHQVSKFSTKDGGIAAFPSKDLAEFAIARSGFNGKAIAYQIKRGEYTIIFSPSEAQERGVWKGDGDKAITFKPEFGAELVEKLGRANRSREKVAVPWQFQNAYDRRKKLVLMGIETNAEFRTALREFAALREAPKEADKVKAMERAMVGRQNDGMDFFPTPASTAQAMIDAAEIEPGMSVLEPSAGMGHIAEQIREVAGIDPDVVELSNERKELLEAKGFRVVGRDFMDINPREFYTYGDTFKTEDGTEGVMRGSGGLGSNRVRLVVGGAEHHVDRDELTGIRKNGTDSGYDRIVMNPPFGARRDAEHVQHAYTLLRPGGRLVALMGEGVFFGQDKKAVAFREWLESVGGTSEKLEEGTFLDPSLPVNTGVNARMVVVDRGNEAAEETPAIRSVSEGGPIPDSEWMSVAAVQELVENLVKPFEATVIPIKILDSATDIGIKPADNGVTSGVVKDGVIYLFRDGLANRAKVAMTLWHEMLHFGVRRFMTQGQYISSMNNLYQRDEWVRQRADFWMKGEEAAELRESKRPEAYIRARGVDEALSELAEILKSEPTGFRTNTLSARLIRAVREWIAALADRFGFHDAAKGWRDHMAQREARELVVSIFGKLKDGSDPSDPMRSWVHSDPAFSRSPSGNSDNISRMADKNTVAGTQAPTSAGDGFTGSAIDVDGVMRPASDSRGNSIAATESAIRDFWRWFGDSKVVDSSGRPLVVFHGTTAKFTEFDRSERGTNTNASGAERGFFFAGDSSDSNLYVEIAQSRARNNYEEEPEGRILKVYLKASNPLILTPFEEANIDEDTVNELIDSDPAALEYANDNGFDAVIWPHGNINNSAYTAVVFQPDQIRLLKPNEPSASADSDVKEERDENNDPSEEEARVVQEGLTGKTPVEAADWLAENAPPRMAIIAAKVRDKLQSLADDGVRFGMSIVNAGDTGDTDLSGARGATIPVQTRDGVAVKVLLNGKGMAGRVGVSYRTALHELTHAATMQTLRLGQLGDARYAKAAEDLNDVAFAIQDHLNNRIGAANSGAELSDFERQTVSRSNNFMHSADEVLVWALSSPEAQAYLEAIPYRGKSMWTAFVEAVRKLIGLSPSGDTALSELLRVSEVLLKPARNGFGSRLNSPDGRRYEIQQPGNGLNAFKSPGGEPPMSWSPAGNNGDFDAGNQDIRYSKNSAADMGNSAETESFVADFLSELSFEDDAFRHEISQSKTLEGNVLDALPGAEYLGEDTRHDEREESQADHRYVFAMPNETIFYVYARGKEVWIDVSRLRTGDRGSAVYHGVANYAYNTGKVFVGDPSGVSEDAIIRRTSAMLSSVLRFGTTSHIDAAPEQIKGVPEKGIEPLDWRGDDLAKTKALIHTFVTTLQNQFPGIENYRYDFGRLQFVDGRGRPVDATRLDLGAASPGGRASRAGQASMRRGILIQSLASSESSERPGLLELVLNGSAQLVSKQGGLKSVFSKNSAVNKTGISQQAVRAIADRVSAKWNNGPLIQVFATIDEARAVTGERLDDSVEGWYQNGKVHLVAENLTGEAHVAQVLTHEAVGHYAVEQTLGDTFGNYLKRLSLMEKTNKAIAEIGKLVDKRQPGLSAETRTAEILAIMAERGMHNSLLSRIRAALQDFVRNVLRYDMDLNEHDVAAMIRRAAKSIEGGPNRGGRQESFGDLAAQFSANSAENDKSNLDNPDDTINIEGIESLLSDENAITKAESVFLSAFPKSTRTYRRTAPTARAAKAASDTARFELGTDAGGTRRVNSVLGAFTGYETREIVAKGLDGKEHLIVQVFGKEQIEAGFDHAPALVMTVDLDGEFSIYGPPSSSTLYQQLSRHGWAEPARDAEGTPHATLDGGFWTKLTGATRKQSIELMGDAHARALEWLGVDHVGLHWKRTTGATGSKEGREGAIYFSMNSALSADNEPTLAQGLRQKVADLFTNQKTFNWWHRNVGTQFHKAKIDSDFGRVYNLAQQYIDDISRFASEAADQAPDLLPKLDKFSDAINGFKNWKRDGKDAKAISGAVYAGTLDDEKVYSDVELRDRFNLDERQIGLFRQFRAAVDRSMDDLAKAEMIKLANTADLELALPELSLEETASFYGNQLDAAIQTAEDAANLTGQLHAQQLQALAARQDLGEYDAIRDALKAQQAAEAQAVNARLKEVLALREGFNGRAERTAQLKREGYAPLMRFGKHTVDVYEVDEGGNPINYPDSYEEKAGQPIRHFFGMFESQAEANEAARLLQEDYPSARVEQGIASEQSHSLFGGVNPGTVEMLARIVGEEDEVMQRYLKMATASRSAMKRLIHRKKIAGHSEDVIRSLASFIVSNARAASSNLHFGEMLTAAEAIPKHKGDVKDEAVKLVNYIRNPEEEMGGLRGLLFIQYIGGSLASAAINLTQTLTTTYPFLHQFGGTVADLAAASKMAGGKLFSGEYNTGQNANLQRAIQLAEEEGIVAPHNIHTLMGESIRPGLMQNKFMRNFTHLWGSAFGLAEQFNREVAFIAAYNIAMRNGKDGDAAYQFAKNAVAETQFVYSKASRPNWARGAVGAVLFTFKQFQVFYVELFKRLPAKERAIMLTTLILLAGMSGIPGADDLDDLIDTLGQALGYDTNSKRWKTDFTRSTLGKAGGEFAQDGVSAFLPIDISKRLGFGNMIPGTAAFKRSETDRSRDALEFFGAAGGQAKSLFDAFDYAVNGEYGKAIYNAIGPKAVKDAFKGYDMADTGIYSDTHGRKVTEVSLGEAVMKGIGFQPTSVSDIQQAKGIVMQDVNLAKAVSSAIAEMWAQGVAERNPEKSAKARAMRDDWNLKNPDSRINIKPASVQQRVRAMQATASDRMVKATPKEMRARVRVAMED